MSVLFPKGPDDQLDYAFDWTALLAGDVIDSADWTVPDGLESVKEGNSQTLTAIMLKGGEPGTTYKVFCKITSAATPPLIIKKFFRLRIRKS